MHIFDTISRTTILGIVLATMLVATGCATSPTLLYENNNEIWKMHEDGSGQVKLASGANRPHWIPKTKDMIAYLRYQGSKAALFVADTDGKNEKQLTQYNIGDNFSWSLDRSWIVFDSDRHGNRQIYKVNVNTKQEIRLTNNKFNDKRPSWSPKGNQIAFESDRRNGDWDVLVMDANGGSVMNLTDGLVGDGYDGKAVWSPDGTRIAYVGNHVGWGGPKICVAHLTSPSTTGPFSQYGSVTQPLWSPSGDYIFYLNYQNGTYSLYKQEAILGKKSQVLSTGWSAPPAGALEEYMDADLTTLFFVKGVDLYSVQWRVGGENKLTPGYHPDVW